MLTTYHSVVSGDYTAMNATLGLVLCGVAAVTLIGAAVLWISDKIRDRRFSREYQSQINNCGC